ncbi:hypothetical protein K3495_g3811 [Podosphaera aphanis]|nr:hypothetical protein K3495_g3811 [Podosphaera aphanis]
MGSDRARPAYVEEVDEFGRALQETRRSAQTPHTPHRTIKGARRATIDGDRDEIPRTTLRVEVPMKESLGIDSPKKSARPHDAQEIPGYPPLGVPSSSGRYDPSYFMGTQPCMMPPRPMMLPHRPRAPTVNAYPPPPGSYGAIPHGVYYGPPPSMPAFRPQTGPLAPGYPPPPPSPSFGGAPYGGYQIPMPKRDFAYHPPPVTSRPLASRFQSIEDPVVDPISRTSSAFGMRDAPRLAYIDSFDEEGYNSVSEVATGKKKHRRAGRGHDRSPLIRDDEEEDAGMAMPPPPPPGKAPRHGILRRTSDYHGHHYDQNDHHEARSSYQDAPRSRRPSVSYDLSHGGESVRLEPASSRRRRQSWYEKSGSTSSVGYEAKLQQASSYVEDATGPDSAPLTVETLKRQQKRQDSSSRSTKSSASRDESDFKKSVTTRTTRSASANDDENMTIKVTGSARVLVAGAQIECTDGGAIEIKRDKVPREIGERLCPDYGEARRAIEDQDRRSHYEKPPRSRISSQPYRHSSAYRESGGDYY